MPDPKEPQLEPEAEEEEAPARPDGFQLVKGGTTIAYIDGERYRLRRPRTGEYKALVLLARERDDELADMREQAAIETEVTGSGTLESKVLAEMRATIESVELDGVAIAEEVKAALVAAAEAKLPEPDRETATALMRKAREWGRRIADRQDELHAAWMLAAFNGDGERRGLADKPLPADIDEWPPWLTRAEYTGRLLSHWGADPLVPGQQ